MQLGKRWIRRCLERWCTFQILLVSCWLIVVSMLMFTLIHGVMVPILCYWWIVQLFLWHLNSCLTFKLYICKCRNITIVIFVRTDAKVKAFIHVTPVLLVLMSISQNKPIPSHVSWAFFVVRYVSVRIKYEISIAVKVLAN